METEGTKMQTEIDQQVRSFSESINSKEEFNRIVTRLALLLSKKIGLRYSDVHQVGKTLYSVETRITDKFTEVYGGQTVSVETAQQTAEKFRSECIDKVLNGESL